MSAGWGRMNRVPGRDRRPGRYRDGGFSTPQPLAILRSRGRRAALELPREPDRRVVAGGVRHPVLVARPGPPAGAVGGVRLHRRVPSLRSVVSPILGRVGESQCVWNRRHGRHSSVAGDRSRILRCGRRRFLRLPQSSSPLARGSARCSSRVLVDPRPHARPEPPAGVSRCRLSGHRHGDRHQAELGAHRTFVGGTALYHPARQGRRGAGSSVCLVVWHSAERGGDGVVPALSGWSQR